MPDGMRPKAGGGGFLGVPAKGSGSHQSPLQLEISGPCVYDSETWYDVQSICVVSLAVPVDVCCVAVASPLGPVARGALSTRFRLGGLAPAAGLAAVLGSCQVLAFTDSCSMPCGANCRQGVGRTGTALLSRWFMVASLTSRRDVRLARCREIEGDDLHLDLPWMI